MDERTSSEAIDMHEEREGGPIEPGLLFEAFYAEEHARLFGLMCLVTADRSEAEEITQEAFVRVWERWARVAVMERPGGYLQRTAMNEFRRRTHRRGLATRFLPRLTQGRYPQDPNEGTVLLHEALQVLEPRQRAALVLTELLGYSAEEAGRVLGVKASTIGALKYQGRARLKEVEIDD